MAHTTIVAELELVSAGPIDRDQLIGRAAAIVTVVLAVMVPLLTYVLLIIDASVGLATGRPRAELGIGSPLTVPWWYSFVGVAGWTVVLVLTWRAERWYLRKYGPFRLWAAPIVVFGLALLSMTACLAAGYRFTGEAFGPDLIPATLLLAISVVAYVRHVVVLRAALPAPAPRRSSRKRR